MQNIGKNQLKEIIEWSRYLGKIYIILSLICKEVKLYMINKG